MTAALPEFIAPMLAQLGKEPFDSDEHVFEIKWDGIRGLAFVEGGDYRLRGRSKSNLKPRYPELAFLSGLESGLVLGIRDYFRKQGLPPGAVIGLSGGIDSAVTAHLAERALGADRVLGIAMPGPFSSEHSVTDAEQLARNLGIETRTVRIDAIYKSFLEQFEALFGAQESYGLTQENLQARVRGTLLMAVSNFEDRIVLATGNKSELSVGYTTLYGDLVGGLAVLGDVLKRDVYALARASNRDAPRVPATTIDKPPSAELAPDQLDSDSLPEYPVLDQVLEQAIERGVAGADIRAPAGAGDDTVIGADFDTIWTLTGLGSGMLGAADFVGIENLAGGVGRDSFVLTDGGEIEGLLDGGGGDDDTLDYSALTTAVLVNIGVGFASRTGALRNVESIIGGSRRDRLLGPDGNSTWRITGPDSGTVGGVAFARAFRVLAEGGLPFRKRRYDFKITIEQLSTLGSSLGAD